MSIEPTNLNISLERKDRLGYWVVAGCALFTGASALINVDFAIAFSASCIVSLPALWFAIISNKGRKPFSLWGNFRLITLYAVLFCYIAIAKTVLIPALQTAIHHALA